MLTFEQYAANQGRYRIAALEAFADQIQGSDIRLHMSESPQINPRTQGQYIAPGYYRTHGKPHGLWYAVGADWLEFCIREFHSAIGSYIFEIDVNPARMLFLKSDQDAESLERRYPDAEKSVAWGQYKSTPTYTMSHGKADGTYTTSVHPYMPNWTAVARDYWGIELDPSKVYTDWIRDWAVHSGCIWHKRGVRGVKLLAQYDPQTRQYQTSSDSALSQKSTVSL